MSHIWFISCSWPWELFFFTTSTNKLEPSHIRATQRWGHSCFPREGSSQLPGGRSSSFGNGQTPPLILQEERSEVIASWGCIAWSREGAQVILQCTQCSIVDKQLVGWEFQDCKELGAYLPKAPETEQSVQRPWRETLKPNSFENQYW